MGVLFADHPVSLFHSSASTSSDSKMPCDPTSLSNLKEVKTNHIHLDLVVNFITKTLTGSAELTVQALTDSVTKVVLDTSYIDIHSVTLAGKSLKVRALLVTTVWKERNEGDSYSYVCISRSQFRDDSTSWRIATKSSVLP